MTSRAMSTPLESPQSSPLAACGTHPTHTVMRLEWRLHLLMQVPQQPGAQLGYWRPSLHSGLREGLRYKKALGSPESPGILLSMWHTVLKARG